MKKLYIKRKLPKLLLAFVLFTSCGDFLQEQSQDLVYATSCEDLNELLVGNGYMEFTKLYSPSNAVNLYYPWLYVMDDDATEGPTGHFTLAGSIIGIVRQFHTWHENPFLNISTGNESKDLTWKKIYAHLSIANLLISEVKNFPGDDPVLRRKIMGEVLFLRGAYYFLLANSYASPYVEATAETDLCVPMKLTEYVEDKYYVRNSNAEVYAQIIKDLDASADSLKGVEQTSIYRASEKAARTLLGRVYLYTHQYEKAIAESQKVIQLGAEVWELNGVDFTETGSSKLRKQYLLEATCPEIFFTQGSSFTQVMMVKSATNPGTYRVSDDLYEVFKKTGDKDLRLKGYFTQDKGNYFVRKNTSQVAKINVFDGFVLRASEVYLNKAEAEVYADKESDCKETLKFFLPKRYANRMIPDIDNLSGKELVQFIREERRRELCFECHRWFDLRRYAVHPEYPETKSITHEIWMPGATRNDPPIYDGAYTLKEYGDEPAYMMPIPTFEIEFNKGSLEPNVPRTPREKM